MREELTTELENLLGKLKLDSRLEASLTKRAEDVYSEFAYEFIPRREAPTDRRVALKQGPYRIFSDFCGDGIQRGVILLSTLKLSKDTAMFIEEVETFQHPEALQKLAKHMVELARENNVQLFITTHSFHDALNYFHYAFENDAQRQREFRSFVVTRRSDGKVQVAPKGAMDIIRELYPSA